MLIPAPNIVDDDYVPSLIENLSFKDLVELHWELAQRHNLYNNRPVTIREFIESDEFLGNFFDKNKNNLFYPFWMKKLEEIYPSEFHSPYSELIWDLPIGSGKSLTASSIVLYEIYKLQCIKEPRALYSLAPGTRIVFSIFSATLSLAGDVNWEYFDKLLTTSRYFLKNCPLPDGGKQVTYKSVVFPGNIAIDLGSQATHAIGKAVFGALLDEANFQRAKSEQAKNNYLALKRRRSSRFISFGGSVAGKLMLLSSPKLATDFLEEQKKSSRDLPTTQIIDNTPIWEIRSGSQKDIYSGKTFKIFIGSSTKDPFIMDETKSKDIRTEDLDLVRDVPVEYHGDFYSDIHTSLQDIFGLAVTRSFSFINSPEKLEQACVMKNRTTKDIVEVDFYDEDSKLSDFIEKDYFTKIPFKDCYRFIHVDLAKTTDRAAISSVFCRNDDEYLGKSSKKTGITETEVVGTDRIYYTEFTLYISAKHGQEIPLYKITDFILYLKKTGYPILKVSADQYQSVDLLQRLKVSGFETEVVSVDKTKIPYVSAKQLIYRGKFLLPNSPTLKKEFLDLVYDGEKIDHPSSGSKDGSDSVVGAFWSALNSQTIQSTAGIFEESVRGMGKEKKLEKMFNHLNRQKNVEDIFKGMFVR